jgi:hypothetical protein
VDQLEHSVTVAVVDVVVTTQLAPVLMVVVPVAQPRVAQDQVAQLQLTLDQAVVALVTMTLAALAVQVFALLSIGVRTWHTLQKSLTESLLT